MKKVEKSPIVTLSNNTPDPVSLRLFAVDSNSSQSSLNASTTYTWNVYGDPFTNLNYVLLKYRKVGEVAYQDAYQSVIKELSSMEEVLAILNSFNLGFFYAEGSLIKTQNDSLQFGELEIKSVINPDTWFFLLSAPAYYMNVIDNDLAVNNDLHVFCRLKCTPGHAWYRAILRDTNGVLPDVIGTQHNTFGVLVPTNYLSVIAGQRMGFENGYNEVAVQVSSDTFTWFDFDTMPVTETLSNTSYWGVTDVVKNTGVTPNRTSWKMIMPKTRSYGELSAIEYMSNSGGNNMWQVNAGVSAGSAPVGTGAIQNYNNQRIRPMPQPNQNVSNVQSNFLTAGLATYQVGFMGFKNASNSMNFNFQDTFFTIYGTPFWNPMVFLLNY